MKSRKPIHRRLSVSEAAERLIRQYGDNADYVARGRESRAATEAASEFWQSVGAMIDRSRVGLD